MDIILTKEAEGRRRRKYIKKTRNIHLVTPKCKME